MFLIIQNATPGDVTCQIPGAKVDTRKSISHPITFSRLSLKNHSLNPICHSRQLFPIPSITPDMTLILSTTAVITIDPLARLIFILGSAKGYLTVS